MTKFLNISTDNTLGGNSPSDETVSSQKAIKSYVEDFALNNKATGSNSLTLLGNATSNSNAVNIGHLSTVVANGVSIGSQATTTETNSIAIGYAAIVTADYAIQLGIGTNAESGSLYVGTSNSNNYKLLGSDGKIPVARIPDLSSTYQATLVSGTNIKTINNQSILGSGNIDISGGGGSSYTPNLFDSKWSDYELNDQSWLRSDTFSWQDGTVYSDAYNHLLADVQGKPVLSETVGSHTIYYQLADDGHKITGANSESVVQDIYEETGVAWYYVLDGTNQRFKLPRTKYGFTGLRDSVGKYVPESLPNIKGDGYAVNENSTLSGAFYDKKNNATHTSGSFPLSEGKFDASLVSSSYQDNAPVQQRATQMYLYFYVGQFSQSATEQTAGLNSEMFNSKQDVLPSTVDYVVESYRNGANWYRIYKSGWVEQGGQTTTGETTNLLKNFSHTDYTVEISLLETSSYPYAWRVYDRTVSNFKSAGDNGSNGKPSMWVAFGQGA